LSTVLKTSMRAIESLIRPRPKEETEETSTITTESDVIIRIARVDFTWQEYLGDSVVVL
jgi:hypothetical protein